MRTAKRKKKNQKKRTARSIMSFNISNQSAPSAGNHGNQFKVLMLAIGSLAAVGVVINLAAFAYVIYSPKIRQPLKVTLFNLVGCDCIFLTGVFISSVVDRSAMTYVCPVTTFMILVPSPVSYSAVLGLAGYNFIAVFKATHFTTYVTTSRTVIISVVVWGVTILATVLSIAIGSRPDFACTLLSQVPSFLLVLSAVYCILCSFGMVMLNIAVAVKLRSTRSSNGGHSKNKVVPSMDAEDTFYRPDSTHLPQFLEVPKSLPHSDVRSSDIHTTRTPLAALDASHLYSLDTNDCLEGHRLNTSSQTSLHTTKSRFYATISDSVNTSPPLDQEMQHEKTKHRNGIGDSTTTEEPTSDKGAFLHNTKGISSMTDISSSIINENSQTATQVSITGEEHLKSRVYFDLPNEPSLPTQPLTLRLHSKRTSSTLPMNSTYKEKACYDISDNTTIFKCPSSQTSKTPHHPSMPRMSSRMRTTIVTLTILAFWNAGMTFPTLGMWIWMATVKNLAAEVAFSRVVTVMSVLATLNSVINPIIYAWRFVDWRRLCTWLCKHGSFALATGSKAMESRLNTVISH